MSDLPSQSSELSTLRAAAISLISKTDTPDSVQAGAKILEQVIQIESQLADIEKTRLEQRKLESDISTGSVRVRSEERKHIATLLAPLLTTIVLAGTLILQTYQTLVTERDKQAEQQRQRDTAEDLRWGETLKALSGEVHGISPGTLSFVKFLESPRYGASARKTAQVVLVQAKDIEQFRQLFSATFVIFGWSDLNDILSINRTISNQYRSVITKNYDGEKLTAEEESSYRYFIDVMGYLSSSIASVLRSSRLLGFNLDLSDVTIGFSDLSGADLRDADLNRFNPTSVNVENADLRGAKNYETASWEANVWWRARKIDKDMLRFLAKNFFFKENPKVGYGGGIRGLSQKEYDEAIRRLNGS